MILKVEDCLAVGICLRGQKRFCRQHGIDYRAFEKDGIEIETLAHIEDNNLFRAIEHAAARQGAK